MFRHVIGGIEKTSDGSYVYAIREGVFMYYYRDTNLNDIYISIFHILIVVLIELYMCKGSDEFVMYTTIILGFCYLFCFVSTALSIVLKRRKAKEIQKNGRCYFGTVEALMEIEVETIFNRFGHAVSKTAYYLKVLPKNEINANHFVYSDVLIGRKGQKISKDVLIYDWYGKIFVICTSIKAKQHYKVEKVEHNKKVMRYTWCRQCLISSNQLLVINEVLLLLAWIYITFTGA